MPCNHKVPLPPEKKSYQFYVYYPWNFETNTPFIAQNYLRCAAQAVPCAI